jgi:sulfate adenylyltransferase subunit 1 (EFTu-like GTPase family)
LFNAIYKYVNAASAMQDNNIILHSKESTYYQGKIIMQQFEKGAGKKDEAG